MIKLNDQQERFVLSGHAAFAERERIYDEFTAAFPEAIDKFSEEVGEQNYRPMLKRIIRELHPGHPKFDEEKHRVQFDGLRRYYLNTQEEAFMGQHRNRLEVADEMRRKLLRHADANPEELVECMKVLNQVNKQAMVESIEHLKVQQETATVIAPDELMELVSRLPPDKRAEAVNALRGGEHPEIVIQRIQKELEATGDEQSTDEAEQSEKVLPVLEDLQSFGSQDTDEAEQGTVSVDQGANIPQEGEHPQSETDGDDIPY